jgi:lysylphosphatidylglycerol synthetase-like protein (DUF2156 family)
MIHGHRWQSTKRRGIIVQRSTHQKQRPFLLRPVGSARTLRRASVRRLILLMLGVVLCVLRWKCIATTVSSMALVLPLRSRRGVPSRSGCHRVHVSASCTRSASAASALSLVVLRVIYPNPSAVKPSLKVSLTSFTCSLSVSYSALFISARAWSASALVEKRTNPNPRLRLVSRSLTTTCLIQSLDQKGEEWGTLPPPPPCRIV